MNEQAKTDTTLIGYCGLYCANCGRYKKGKCPGCADNKKAAWCKIRTCCIEKGIANCSACDEFSDPKTCRIYNNLPSRVIEFFSSTDRTLCIDYLKLNSPETFITMMNDQGGMSLPKRKASKKRD